MNSTMKTLTAILLAYFLTSAVSIPVFAEEKGRSLKEDAETAAKTMVNYPANIVNESVEVVATAAKNTADVVVGTLKVTGETLTGDLEKAPEIVTTPVKGTAETVRDTVAGIVEAPVKAGEKTAEQNR